MRRQHGVRTCQQRGVNFGLAFEDVKAGRGDPMFAKRSARLGRLLVDPTIGLTAMLMTRPGRSQYTEIEAAEELGVSVEHLRKIIRSHVVDQEEDANNIPVHTFQPSDLLILRLLAGMPTTPTQQD